MSACHPPTPRTPLATEPNTPYCPINAVDPSGLLAGPPTLMTRISLSLGRAIGVDLALGGPENPMADIVALAVLLSPLLWKSGDEPLVDTMPPKRRKRIPLYHYTSACGFKGIIGSMSIYPSTGSKYARHGSGQYFSDIAPKDIGNTMTEGQAMRYMFGQPWGRKNRMTHYITVDVSGLPIQNPKPHIFLNPSETPLDITDRILGGGER